MSIETILKISQLLGSIGIFMIGMIILTEGLRALAGDPIRKVLMRFAKTPSSGSSAAAPISPASACTWRQHSPGPARWVQIKIVVGLKSPLP